VRQFPQLHTNPVNDIVDPKPIGAASSSALWCAESVRLLWENRQRFIAETERPAAKAAYERALQDFLQRANETSHDAGLAVPQLTLGMMRLAATFEKEVANDDAQHEHDTVIRGRKMVHPENHEPLDLPNPVVQS